MSKNKPQSKDIKFKSIIGLVGTLQTTIIEVSCKNGYRWKDCLALLDCKGKWLYTGYWRPDGYKKAKKELLSVGYIGVKL